MDVFDCSDAFSNAYYYLKANLSLAEWVEFESNTAAGWMKHCNVKTISNSSRWVAYLEFKTEEDYTAFLLRWN